MKLGMSGAVFYGRMETEDEAAHLTDFPLDVCEIFLETQSEYSASFGAQDERTDSVSTSISATAVNFRNFMMNPPK